MLRHALPALSTIALSTALFACTTGTTTTTGNPSPTGSSTAATDPPAKGSSGGSGTAASALGPQCEEYIECCEEIAADNPQVAASCDSVKDQIEGAQAQGVSTASYEAGCKSGISTFKSAGYCK